MSSTNRRFCRYCGATLTGMKQKVLRTCQDCADKAKENFAKMENIKTFKEGFEGLMDQTADSINQKNQLKNKISSTIQQKPGKIRKMMKKRGYSEEEINNGLKQFSEGAKIED